MIKARHVGAALTIGILGSGSALAGDLTANAGITNNYVWRGLTQTLNDAAVSGGLDFAADNGFYVGTWVSNVKYGDSDAYSFEHDIYFGIGGGEDFTWDVGYLYYNYDEDAGFDFGEIYGSIGAGGFSATVYLNTNVEPDEGPGQDFGFAQSYYASVDYGFEVAEDFEIGLHAGYHAGDFTQAFNGWTDYMDYSVSLSKGGVTFTISDTDIDAPTAGSDAFGNHDVRFIIGYTHEFD